MWADCAAETGRTTNVFRTNLTVKSKVEYFKCQLFRSAHTLSDGAEALPARKGMLIFEREHCPSL